MLTFEFLDIEEGGKIDLEGGGSQAWPLTCVFLSGILLLQLSCEGLNVSMLLLNNLISWQ